jgi:plastocyanin
MRARAARPAALAGLLLAIALASTAAGATASVTIEGFAYTPASVTIDAGDTVTWTNRDSAQHSAVVTGGGPRTPVLANGASGSITFANAGTFSYICGIHGASMMGTVIVRAAAPPPTPVPTPVPTVRQTAPPTTAPTVAPTSEPTPAVIPSPTTTPAPATTAPSATVAVAVPSQPAPAGAAPNDGGVGPALVIGAALIGAIAVGAVAWRRIRR